MTTEHIQIERFLAWIPAFGGGPGLFIAFYFGLILITGDRNDPAVISVLAGAIGSLISGIAAAFVLYTTYTIKRSRHVLAIITWLAFVCLVTLDLNGAIELTTGVHRGALSFGTLLFACTLSPLAIFYIAVICARIFAQLHVQ